MFMNVLGKGLFIDRIGIPNKQRRNLGCVFWSWMSGGGMKNLTISSLCFGVGWSIFG